MLHFTTYEQNPEADWVTFIHGAGGSSAIWFRQIRAFRQQFNVLLIDLRGHGKSKRPTYAEIKRYTFESIGDDVIEVLDHLGISATHFIGISLGSVIIRDLAGRYPKKVKSIVMGGAIMKLNTRVQVLMRLGVMFQQMIPYLWLYKMFAFIVMPRRRHQESRSLFIREAKKLYQKEFRRWFTLASQIKPLLLRFRKKESCVPTLYIMGSEDYMFLPSVAELARQHPSSRLHIIPDCGHVVNVEQPRIFNHQVIGFLRGLT